MRTDCANPALSKLFVSSVPAMQATTCSMRPGAYRAFTFRLPAHLPTAHIAVAVSRGCVSLFASNCARMPAS